jgi:heme-degrading monooxygenase HmoA
MSPYISILTLRSLPGRREEALAQFTQRRVLETCRDVVPGFLSGRLLRSHDDDDLACVICEWTDRAAFEQWMNSPHRRSDASQRLFEASGRSALFELEQELRR